MLTFNKGTETAPNTPIAYLTSKDAKKVLYLKSDAIEEGEKVFKAKVGTKVEPLLDLHTRNVAEVAGQSGSGKSTVAAHLAEQWLRVNKGKPFYFFSRTSGKEDPAFDLPLCRKRMKQIPIDEKMIESPIEIEELKGGCLIVVDDVGHFTDIRLKKAVDTFIMQVMELGRKLDANIIYISHCVIPPEKMLAKIVQNEINSLTIFPKSCSVSQVTYVLKNHFGLSTKQIQEIMQLPSRWVYIRRNYPSYCVHEKGVYLL